MEGRIYILCRETFAHQNVCQELKGFYRLIRFLIGQLDEKVICTYGAQAQLAEHGFWKVANVFGHDGVSAASDGERQNMRVIRVWQSGLVVMLGGG